MATDDHIRERSPHIFEVKFGDEVVDLVPTGASPLRSFVYAMPPPFRNWATRLPGYEDGRSPFPCSRSRCATGFPSTRSE